MLGLGRITTDLNFEIIFKAKKTQARKKKCGSLVTFDEL